MPDVVGAYPVEAGPVGETVYQTTHLLDKQSTTEGIDITKYLPEKYRPTSQATGVMDYTGTGGAAGTPKGVFVRPSLVAITDNGDYILRGLVGSSGDAYLPEEVRIPKEDKDKIQEISGRFTPVYGMTLESIHQNYGSKVQSPMMFNGRKQ
jgi:hypothetical protein